MLDKVEGAIKQTIQRNWLHWKHIKRRRQRQQRNKIQNVMDATISKQIQITLIKQAPSYNWRQRLTEHSLLAEIVTDITTRSSERRHIIKVGYILSSKKTIVNKNSIKFKDIIMRIERLKSSLGNILMYILINISSTCAMY